jgi:hypothetical protein
MRGSGLRRPALARGARLSRTLSVLPARRPAPRRPRRRRPPPAPLQCPAGSARDIDESDAECRCLEPGHGWGYDDSIGNFGCRPCADNATLIDNQ